MTLLRIASLNKRCSQTIHKDIKIYIINGLIIIFTPENI